MSAWNTSAPPKDGTVIVASGRVTWGDDDGGGSDPFVCAIKWFGAAESRSEGFEGWCHAHSGTGLQQGLRDQVHVDFWVSMPDAQTTPPPVMPRREAIRELKEVAELVDVATRTLNVEDYGDALASAKRRLQALIKQLTPEGTAEV